MAHQNRSRSLRRLTCTLVFPYLALLPTTTLSVYTCDYLNDNCPYKIDGVCDQDLFCASGSDCFDCDPCLGFSGDCAACVASSPDCWYCPVESGSGLCLSTALFTVAPETCSRAFDMPETRTCDGTTTTTTEPSDSYTCNVFADTCTGDNFFNLRCDAGSACDAGTDCFDCDPCQQFIFEDCEACTANPGCQYCETDGIGLCYSDSIASQASGLCTGGSSFSSTCGTGNSCDASFDDCATRFDGNCDSGSVLCSAGDCFDCDECQKYRFDGCETCTANGCLWCGKDAACVSELPNFGDPRFNLECKADDFVTQCSMPSVGTDPLNDAQVWAFDLINLQAAWEAGYTGKGVLIRVNDDGVDDTHEEFRGKFDTSNSCSLYKPIRAGRKDNHGTSCASIAASNANGSCSVGVAPNANVAACRTVGSPGDRLAGESEDDRMFYEESTTIDISTNSWGGLPCRAKTRRRRLQSNACPFESAISTSPCRTLLCADADWLNPSSFTSGCMEYISAYCQVFFSSDWETCEGFLDLYSECEFTGLDPDWAKGLRNGVQFGRNGRGIVYLFAAGNDVHYGEDVNFAGLTNSRYTISVGAVGKDGVRARYSAVGAALFVVAPGGDRDHYTDLIVAMQGTTNKCTHSSYGTSFSTPVVAGVVALILDARPELSWRDVQGVLATTSRKVDPDHELWATNAVGISHSPWYGFGLVDAGAAVKAAESWELYSAEQVLLKSSDTVVEIQDEGGTEALTSVIVQEDDLPSANFVAETVTVHMDLRHGSRGHLEVELVSPTGTSSILSPGSRVENSQLASDDMWKLSSVRHWGEPVVGKWTLLFRDEKKGDVSSCVDDPWSFDVQFLSTELEVGCSTLKRVDACANGAAGKDFDVLLAPYGASLTDPGLADSNGATPGGACCACGGGSQVSSIEDVLRSWRLSIYGHGTESGGSGVAGTPSPPQGNDSPQNGPTPTLSPPASADLGTESSVAVAMAAVGIAAAFLI